MKIALYVAALCSMMRGFTHTCPRFWFLLVSCSLLAACATTEFKPFEAKYNLFKGTGGTKIVIDGVEFWDNGNPPRRFKVLGIIEDERPGGIIPMSQLKSDVAKKAAEASGDEVIVLGSNSQIVGFIGNVSANTYAYSSSASTYGTATSIPARRNYAKFAVIKYVD